MRRAGFFGGAGAGAGTSTAADAESTALAAASGGAATLTGAATGAVVGAACAITDAPPLAPPPPLAASAFCAASNSRRHLVCAAGATWTNAAAFSAFISAIDFACPFVCGEGGARVRVGDGQYAARTQYGEVGVGRTRALLTFLRNFSNSVPFTRRSVAALTLTTFVD